MTDWRAVPEDVDTSKPPFDGGDVLIWADSACVNIVRLAFWREPDADLDETEDDRGWWSYKHSVTQEQLTYLKPTHWAPFKQPAPLSDERECPECGAFHMSFRECLKCSQAELPSSPE